MYYIYLYSIISDYSLYLLEMCNILLQIHVFAALLVNVTFLMCIVQFSFFPPSRCFKCVSMNCAYVCSISLRYISCAKMRLSTWGQHCTGVILKAESVMEKVIQKYWNIKILVQSKAKCTHNAALLLFY